MDLGNAYASMGEYDNAVDAFSKALLLDPNNGEILFDIGCVYLLQERLKKCIEYYNKAEAVGYDNVRLYMNMTAIYNALEDKQMELRCYTKAIDKNPTQTLRIPLCLHLLFRFEKRSLTVVSPPGKSLVHKKVTRLILPPNSLPLRNLLLFLLRLHLRTILIYILQGKRLSSSLLISPSL